MIINKKHNFIFVHIQKTAGTSITNVLNKLENSEKLKYDHSFFEFDESESMNYFKFCFVRNPWDRLVSWYNMIVQKKYNNSFSKYILENSKNFSEFIYLTEIIYEKNELEWDGKYEYPKSISFNQLDYISDSNGKILVDFIGKFENLQKDFDFVFEKLNLEKTKPPFLNHFKHKYYTQYYDLKTKEIVYNMYKKDIDYFGYKF